MPPDSDSSDQPDYIEIQCSTRKYFILYRLKYLMKWFGLTLLLVIISLFWVVFFPFSALLALACSPTVRNDPTQFYKWPIRWQRGINIYYCRIMKALSSGWDVEKAKPLPLVRLPRCALSQENITLPQTKSPLMTKLPVELRLQIAGEVINGDSTHVHIIVRPMDKPGRKRHTDKVHGQFFCVAKDSGFNSHCAFGGPKTQETHPNGHGRGVLSLSRTCKQLYAETIGLLYSLPTFYFESINKFYPFFLRSVLPNRLALIKHIQLPDSWNFAHINRDPCSGVRNYKSKRLHALRKCFSCNFHHSLSIIRETMVNLRSIKSSISLSYDSPIPSFDNPKLCSLLSLQHGRNGQRDLQIKVFLKSSEGSESVPTSTPLVPAKYPPFGEFDMALQERLRKGGERRPLDEPTAEGAEAG